MTKTIILLFDGTANTVRANRSNILRLYGCLEKSDRQLVWYSPGVGTFGGEDTLFHYRQRLREGLDRATGWGLDRNVKDAYRFLVAHYDNGKRGGRRVQPRDRVIMFGFSRGAYTARVLAGFLNALGLMAPRHLNLLDQAYRTYKGVAERPGAKGDWKEMDLWYRVLRPDFVPVALLGLFDTVSSVFEWGQSGPRFRAHASTSINPSVAAIRHAIALDERRALYQPLLWPGGQHYFGNRFERGRAIPQDLREMWFAGVHSDVGGGYPESRSALGKVALDWMIRETEPAGRAVPADDREPAGAGAAGRRAVVALCCPGPDGARAGIAESGLAADRDDPAPGAAGDAHGQYRRAVSAALAPSLCPGCGAGA